ncbi:hypothetical protein BS17DRAFT_151536 [Gyrodon lividus]|nr:hypothetical protein BS17DRAFT_151536 [Gyrodon lividus]
MWVFLVPSDLYLHVITRLVKVFQYTDCKDHAPLKRISLRWFRIIRPTWSCPTPYLSNALFSLEFGVGLKYPSHLRQSIFSERTNWIKWKHADKCICVGVLYQWYWYTGISNYCHHFAQILQTQEVSSSMSRRVAETSWLVPISWHPRSIRISQKLVGVNISWHPSSIRALHSGPP